LRTAGHEHQHHGRLWPLLPQARQVGLGANLLEDAIYRSTSEMRPANGVTERNRHTVPFNKGDMPLVSAFWPVTLYDPFSGSKLNKPFRGQQLDAVPLQYRWFARSVLPERKPRPR
jgi:hypothetical protein